MTPVLVRYRRLMWLSPIAGVCLVALFIIRRDGTQHLAVQAAAAPLPAKWDPAVRDPLVHATQVWKLGLNYFEPDYNLALFAQSFKDTTFQRIDGQTGVFLRFPHMASCVQSGCVIPFAPYEDALIRAVETGSPEIKLQALVVLMRVRSPSSVPQQWAALTELQNLDDRPHWKSLLAEWQSCFDADVLRAEIGKAPPENEYSDEPEIYFWSLRAVGVVQDRPSLARLVELSRTYQLSASLAAERSLEDFIGPEGDQALVSCLLGWKYDAYHRAGNSLLVRNKKLLTEVLLREHAPKKARYYQGLLLAKCDEPSAVPILCETVPKLQTIDYEMFEQIARLGRPEHRAAIEALPARVRPEQRARAESTLQAFLSKYPPDGA